MPPAATLTTASPPRTARNGLALTAVCLVALMFGLEISSVPVILPTLERELGTGFQDAQWIMNAYTLACTSVLMAAGTLADRFGRRRMLVLCLWAVSYTHLDVYKRQAYDFGPQLSDLNVAVGVKNIFNTQYFTRSFDDNNKGKYVGEPRTLYVQTSIAF